MFSTKRALIVSALNNMTTLGGDGVVLKRVKEILLSPHIAPSLYPCAIIECKSEDGTHESSEGYLDADFGFNLYLIIESGTDPDADIYNLKNAFRVEWKKLAQRDIPNVEYYSTMSSAQTVRVAKISLMGL